MRRPKWLLFVIFTVFSEDSLEKLCGKPPLWKTSTFLLPFLEEHGMMEARERLSVLPGAGPRWRWCS